MKKLVGQGFSSARRMPPSVETRAIPILRSMATPGFPVRRWAAAAGVMTSVRTSRTPTTWIASAVVRAISRKIRTDSTRSGTPRDSATSGSTLEKSKGR